MRLPRSLLVLGLASWVVAGAHSWADPWETISFPGSATADAERTAFQVAGAWRGEYDIRSDVAIVYGVNASLRDRIAGFKARGYGIHLMTGVAWGGYGDYFEGKFDGKNHLADEAQRDAGGKTLWHGGPPIPYVMPSESYAEYLKTLLTRAVDAGATAIHMEEPEFWVRAGYSPGFKAEWEAYYGEPWQPPHSSPDARYRSAKLKYHLYYRTLESLFKHVKKISGGRVGCYVPTHSLVNYAHWRIVSPMSSLMNLAEADGYIAQVWTGTARTPNRYGGVLRERTFETALVEYGQMMSMVRPTGRRTYFLADPVEDNPNHGWDDYKVNYECTLLASLFYPSVYHFEVMPWPSRVFLGKYPRQDPRRTDADTTRIRIPKPYATELLTLINALNDMKQTEIKWDVGLRGVGCVLSDTVMFQRGQPHASDPHMGSLYGLVLPLMKHGIFVEPVQLETILTPRALLPYRTLLLSYEHQKPLKPEYHHALGHWVRAGGALVVVDKEEDPYNAVREWWNQDGRDFKTPLEHLRKTLGLPLDASDALHKVGKGVYLQRKLSPARLSASADGPEIVRSLLKEALRAVGHEEDYREQNYILLRRGPYVIANVFDQSVYDRPLKLAGRFLDLFDPTHTVSDTITLAPGQRRFLMDLDRLEKRPVVAASASRITGWRAARYRVRFVSKGPVETECITTCLLPGEPTSIHVSRKPALDADFAKDGAGGILRLRYPNTPDGVNVAISWRAD
jgi:hypothetical protein